MSTGCGAIRTNGTTSSSGGILINAALPRPSWAPDDSALRDDGGCNTARTPMFGYSRSSSPMVKPRRMKTESSRSPSHGAVCAPSVKR